ncbi:hypothetical protein EYF80_055998 [Liparis tanakae]|uniref:Uncharacterized protein n=1 Tax=Liparis tanakae TaxID=230148 RepID=A0A4Z2EY97_9TELE|nr:hypothetical protein EYF80_055998 [Liparis tanakae]
MTLWIKVIGGKEKKTAAMLTERRVTYPGPVVTDHHFSPLAVHAQQMTNPRLRSMDLSAAPTDREQQKCCGYSFSVGGATDRGHTYYLCSGKRGRSYTPPFCGNR